MRDCRIQTLNTYSDWLSKANYEYSLFVKSCSVYDLANCLLTINAIPEWIIENNHASEALKAIATEKIAIMRAEYQCISLNENNLHEIDHQLRLVRTFCNHAKHGKEKEKIVAISMSAQFPLNFPVKFEYLKVGNKNILIEPILKSLIEFWSQKITLHQ